MVENFTPPKRYELGSLKPFIYLIPESVAVNYTIDDGRCAVHSIAQSDSIIRVSGDIATMTSEETLEGRFKFHNAVELTVQEGSYDRLTDLFHLLEIGTRFRCAVEDMMGNQFLINVEFPAFVTHEAQFANTIAPNTISVRLETDSNWPSLFIQSKIGYFSKFNLKQCSYVMGGISEFYLGDRKMVRMIENNGKIISVLSYGSSNFKKIEPLPNTLVFTEKFDGESYTQQIQFSIPLSEYKHYFEYNLIEFKDNRYACLLVTKNNILLGSGFELGFIPSYNITTSESVSGLNTIAITMTCISLRPTADTTLTTSLHDFIGDDKRVSYAPVKPFKIGDNQYLNDICINDAQSMYTLLELTTTNGAGLKQYAAHVDYAEMYREAGLDVVTTFNTDGIWNGIPIVHPNLNCAFSSGQCLFRLVPNKRYVLTSVNDSVTFPVWSECDWSINNVPNWMVVTPMNGPGGTVTKVKISLTLPIPNDPVDATLTLTNPMQNYPFTIVFRQGSSSGTNCDWLQVEESAYTAQGGTTYFSLSDTVPPGTTMDNVIIVDNGGVDVQVRNGLLQITIPKNLTGNNKSYNIRVRLDQNHPECTISILQDGRFYKRVVADGYICEGNYKYQKIAVYWGNTADTVTNFLEYEKGALIEVNSKDCMNFIEKWVNGEGYVCQDNRKYTYQIKKKSYDNGQTWEDTDEWRVGDYLGVSTDCGGEYDTKWEWNGYDKVCEGTSSYQLEKQFISYDKVHWLFTGETRRGSALRTDDPYCGGAVTGEYRWVSGDGFICENKNKYKVLEEEYSVDNGLSWQKTGVTKPGDLIEENSSACSDESKWKYEWQTSDYAFVCDENGTSHKIEYYVVSYDNGLSWHQTGQQRSDGVIMENDPRCTGSEALYRWVDMIGYYICDDDPTNKGKYCKYQRQKMQVSTDGIVFIDVTPSIHRKGVLLGCNLPVCSVIGDESEITYEKWVDDPTEYVCEMGDKYHVAVKYVSIDNVQWAEAVPRETAKSSLWQKKSDDCYIWTVVDGEYICEQATETWNVEGHYCGDEELDVARYIWGDKTDNRPEGTGIEVGVWAPPVSFYSVHGYFANFVTPTQTSPTLVAREIKHIDYLPSIELLTGLTHGLTENLTSDIVDFSNWANRPLPRLNSLYNFLSIESNQKAYWGYKRWINLENIDTSHVCVMASAFANSPHSEINLSGWNTDNVYTMCQMFIECNNLVYLDLSNFNADNVVDASRMFAFSPKLTKIRTNTKFKNWCEAHAEEIYLPENITWELTD